MVDLMYAINCSLDGFIEDKSGSFDWSEPTEEVHRFIGDLLRGIGTHLYGRRMYQTMAVWETDPSFAAHAPYMRDFAEIWQAADKIVFSKTLQAVSTARTRIERTFDPQAIRDLKASATRDILIGGPNLGAQAFRAGLVDQCHLLFVPVSVGDGKRALPDDIFLKMELEDQRRFGSGVVFLRYRVKAW